MKFKDDLDMWIQMINFSESLKKRASKGVMEEIAKCEFYSFNKIV